MISMNDKPTYEELVRAFLDVMSWDPSCRRMDDPEFVMKVYKQLREEKQLNSSMAI